MPAILILVQVILIFILQRRVTFMLEDTDFSYNLATGEKLASLKDVFQSQFWAFKNRGGSFLAGTIYQTLLLLGEGFSNFINTIVYLLVAVLISYVSGVRRQRLFFVSLSMALIICLNTDWLNTYFWQFGFTQYMIPSVFLLFYLRLFIRVMDDFTWEPSRRRVLLVCLCGFLGSWWNGGVGLVCMGIFLGAFLLHYFILRRRTPVYLVISGLCALAGFLLYVIAPGNYKPDSIMSGIYLSFGIFPSVALSLIMMAVLLRAGGFLTPSQILMLLALGGAVLFDFLLLPISGVAVNGLSVATLILSVCMFTSLLNHMNKSHPGHWRYAYLLSFVMILYSVMTLLGQSVGVY